MFSLSVLRCIQSYAALFESHQNIPEYETDRKAGIPFESPNVDGVAICFDCRYHGLVELDAHRGVGILVRSHRVPDCGRRGTRLWGV